MSSSESPFSDMKEKVIAVLQLQMELGLSIGEDAQKVRSATLTELEFLINFWRAATGKAAKIHLARISDLMNHPSKITPGFLLEVTHALGLNDLGFSDSIWAYSKNDILSYIRKAYEGGVLALCASNHQHHDLLVLKPETPMGINWAQDIIVKRPIEVPEMIVRHGWWLQTKANLPHPAYLRTIAYEDGKYKGMNGVAQIPNDHIEDIGRQNFGRFQVHDEISRTYIYAFACSEYIFEDWPDGTTRTAPLSHGDFLSLVESYFATEHCDKSHSVQSFVTVQ